MRGDGRIGYYAAWAWRAVVMRDPRPLIYGVALTDRCNLACTGCRIHSYGRPDMTWEALVAALQGAYQRGFREVYFSGGEPMLWRSGEHALEDAIAEARRIGFFHTHVYTNGTLGLNCSADLVWVSVDGLPEVYATRRGDHFAQVEAAIRAPGHPKVAVIYVIDRNTREGVEPFLRWVRDSALPVTGVMFYFQTPYYGYDELYLDAEERSREIDGLLGCIASGLPVLNSRAGLAALKSGRWERRTHTAAVVDVDGESWCCRAPDECCQDCGYAACTEIIEAVRLKPSAVLAMGRYW